MILFRREIWKRPWEKTHLVPERRVRLPNYALHTDYRLMRTGCGTAFAVKTSIGQSRDIAPLSGLEATVVELRGDLVGLLIVSACKPPRSAVIDAERLAVFSAHKKVIQACDLEL